VQSVEERRSIIYACIAGLLLAGIIAVFAFAESLVPVINPDVLVMTVVAACVFCAALALSAVLHGRTVGRILGILVLVAIVVAIVQSIEHPQI